MSFGVFRTKMKLFITLASILSLGLATPLETKFVPVENTNSRIIDGKNANEGQFPWQVAVRFSHDSGTWSFCGGTLISDQWVLTAGHCAYGADNFTITLGVISLKDPNAVTASVEEAVVHPEYSRNTLANDIALLKLSKPVQLSNTISPITYLSVNAVGEDESLTVSGWGKISDESTTVSNDLNYVELTTITNDDCASFYGDTIVPGMICCVGNKTKSTCNGDSGGPLVLNPNTDRPIHVGVVSFVSSRGCESGYPSGYTRTSEYRQWINETTGI